MRCKTEDRIQKSEDRTGQSKILTSDSSLLNSRSFRKVGIQRHRGGLGDVVMALGVAEVAAREWRTKIPFGCPRDLIALGENVPGVEVLPCRPTDDAASTPGAFDRLTFGRLWNIADDLSCFLYEAALQPHVDKNRTEIWAAKLGLKGRVRPRLYLTAQERAWGRQWVAGHGLTGRFLLGIVPKSASWSRDWRGWNILLYRLKKKFPLICPIFFSAEVRSWEEIELATVGIPVIRRPIREMLAILDICHLVAGVDTGPMHAAAALGRPTLWLFTHIDGAIRTQGYEKAEVIQRTDLECCPCWYEAQCHDPRYYMMCKKISVEEVLDKIFLHYQGWKDVSHHNIKNITEVIPRSGTMEGKLCSF